MGLRGRSPAGSPLNVGVESVGGLEWGGVEEGVWVGRVGRMGRSGRAYGSVFMGRCLLGRDHRPPTTGARTRGDNEEGLMLELRQVPLARISLIATLQQAVVDEVRL